MASAMNPRNSTNPSGRSLSPTSAFDFLSDFSIRHSALGRCLLCLTSMVMALAVSGCSKKAEVKSQVSELEKAFPNATVAAPAPQAAAPAPAPASASADAYVQSALSAVRQNDYAASVIALQQAQRAPGVTAQQIMAAERAKMAITTDLQGRAERGDPQAKSALAAIEKTLSQ